MSLKEISFDITNEENAYSISSDTEHHNNLSSLNMNPRSSIGRNNA